MGDHVQHHWMVGQLLGVTYLWRDMDCETWANFEAFYKLSNGTEDGIMLEKRTSSGNDSSKNKCSSNE